MKSTQQGFAVPQHAARVPFFCSTFNPFVAMLLLPICAMFLFSVSPKPALASSGTSQEPESVTIQITGTTMGVVKYRVLVVTTAPSASDKAALKSLVVSALERVNDLMSTYKEDSDVSKFNRNESVEWFPVEPETASVVQRALQISQLSEGAFDVTVGPAVKLWNFGPGKTEFEIPDEATVESLRENVGYNLVGVRLEPPALKKDKPGVGIDLSAIAKGYAVDAVVSGIKKLGYDRFMVEVGGEVFAVGERGNGGLWRVAVERPDVPQPAPGTVADPAKMVRVVPVSNFGVATSGDYRNFKVVDGVRYSHTIDPRTCRPVTHELATASVTAPDCMTADAVATAVMVLGAEKGHKFCESNGFELFTMLREGEGFQELASADFPVSELPTEDKIGNSGQRVAPQEKEDGENAVASRPSILPTFIAAFIVFGMVILAMAIGAIFNNKPVQGSCGGLANMTNEEGDEVCGVCSKPSTDCVETVPKENS